MNGTMRPYMDSGLSLQQIDDVPAGHWLAFEPGRNGERYLPGSEHLRLRDVLPGIADITGGRAPTFRIRHALKTFLPV